MGNNDLLGAIAAIFTIIGGAVAIAELVAPRCPTCGNKLVIINNYYYCNKCHVQTHQKTR